MKKICLINKGENLKKITYTLGLKPNKTYDEFTILEDKKYITLNEGDDDIVVVKNYNPYYIRHVNKGETLLDIYALGYEIIGEEGGVQDCLVLHKPTGIRYNVKPLEKIEDIANKFGVDKQYIKESNSLKTDKLFVGQVLII